MKAIVVPRYGGPEVLQERDVPVPAVGPDDVRLRVAATSLQPIDWHFMRGKPLLVRLMVGLRRPRRTILGSDVSGIVEERGANVSHVDVGQAVFGWCPDGGGLAEQVVLDGGNVTPVPDGVDVASTGGVGVAAMTAKQALHDQAGVKPGDRVLIIGASGGVGTYAVQLARLAGATVTAVCSSRNASLVTDLGAHEVVDYTATEVADLGARFDIVLQVAGTLSVSRVRGLLADGGRHVLVGSDLPGELLGPARHAIGVALARGRRGAKHISFTCKENTADLVELRDQLARGEVRVVVDRSFALADAAVAMTYVETGRAQGKVLVTP